jgi:hypothetical protein
MADFESGLRSVLEPEGADELPGCHFLNVQNSDDKWLLLHGEN